MNRTLCPLVMLLVGLSTPASAARNFPLTGKNELSGGIGFVAGITSYSPGGFKWFNDYSRELTSARGKSPGVWFNAQLNLSTGGHSYWGPANCKWDPVAQRYYDCKGHNSIGGTALELGAGVKLKWRLRQIPLQFHAKLGGVLDLLWLYEAFGVGIGFRGGFGVRYFVVPSLGVGAELMLPTVGPAFFNHNHGVNVFATVDFNMGVEWRF